MSIQFEVERHHAPLLTVAEGIFYYFYFRSDNLEREAAEPSDINPV
jgi:hypothetical protein